MTVFVSGSDESAGRTRRDTFYQAGFVAPENDWWRFFAPAWQERVLNGPPTIPYLHMTDIRSSQWRAKYGLSRLDADDRVDEAFILVDTMTTLYPIDAYLDAGHFRDRFATTKLLASSGGAKSFEPDYVCFIAYAFLVLNYVGQYFPEAEKVDFIVECNGTVTKHIQEFHANIAVGLEALGGATLSRLVGELIPGGKDRVPLQAADVLCWHSARSKAKSMDAGDARRYAKIAHRPGCLLEITSEQVSQLADALGV